MWIYEKYGSTDDDTRWVVGYITDGDYLNVVKEFPIELGARMEVHYLNGGTPEEFDYDLYRMELERHEKLQLRAAKDEE